MSITKTFTRDMGRLAIDPNQAGLVAGYDMVPNGVTLEDKSGNGNHGVISGAAFEFTEIGPSMKAAYLNGDYINLGSGFQALTDLTVSFWMIPRESAVTNWIINYYLSIANAWGLRQTVGAPGYVNIDIFDDIDDAGVQRYSTPVKADVAHLITAQMDSLENKLYIDGELVGSGGSSSDNWDSFAGILTMFNRASAFTSSNGSNISNFKIFDRVITQAEIQAEYQAGAKAVNWKSDYGVDVSIAAESTPGELSNSVARIESGTHEMTTDTIHGKTCKVIECATAGVVQIPTAYFHGDDTQAAHGTFEFWIWKAVVGVDSIVGFMNDSPLAIADVNSNGYGFLFTNSRRIQLVEITGGASSSLFLTALNYKPVITWLRIKITRSPDGEFTMYINDEIVDLTGGFGTNPVTDTTHTISKHMTFELKAGDKIAWAAPNGECAIVKYQGVV